MNSSDTIVYIPYVEMDKLPMYKVEIEKTVGLTYVERSVRCFTIVNKHVWMLTVLKTGVKYHMLNAPWYYTTKH